MIKSLGVKIIGTGAYLPGEPITNEEIKEKYDLDFDPGLLLTKVGIRTRHHAPPDMATSYLAAEAGKIAMERAGINASQLDRILLGTSTPDYTNTAASCIVQQHLGATCPVGDTCASCASFMYALDHGIRLIQTGSKYVLVIGADIKSRFVRKDDPKFFPIFGDGAGAFVITSCEQDGFLASELWADGSGLKNIYVPAGGSVMPPSIETVTKGLHGTVMTVSGKEMVDISVDLMANIGLNVCRKIGIDISDIDIFIPHQANYIIMKRTAEKLGIPLHKMEVSIDRVANPVSATLPITFNQACEKNKLTKGKLVLMVTAASGYTGGAAIYKVPD